MVAHQTSTEFGLVIKKFTFHQWLLSEFTITPDTLVTKTCLLFFFFFSKIILFFVESFHKNKKSLMNHGLEVILQVARFWNSRLEWNAEKKRFDINMVIGPDEFHEHINNSAFTKFVQFFFITIVIFIEFLNSSFEQLHGTLDL